MSDAGQSNPPGASPSGFDRSAEGFRRWIEVAAQRGFSQVAAVHAWNNMEERQPPLDHGLHRAAGVAAPHRTSSLDRQRSESSSSIIVPLQGGQQQRAGTAGPSKTTLLPSPAPRQHLFSLVPSRSEGAHLQSASSPVSSMSAEQEEIQRVIREMLPVGFVVQPRFVPQCVKRQGKDALAKANNTQVRLRNYPSVSANPSPEELMYDSVKLAADPRPTQELVGKIASGLGRLSGLLPATDLLDRENHTMQSAFVGMYKLIKGNQTRLDQRLNGLEKEAMGLRAEMQSLREELSRLKEAQGNATLPLPVDSGLQPFAKQIAAIHTYVMETAQKDKHREERLQALEKAIREQIPPRSNCTEPQTEGTPQTSTQAIGTGTEAGAEMATGPASGRISSRDGLLNRTASSLEKRQTEDEEAAPEGSAVQGRPVEGSIGNGHRRRIEFRNGATVIVKDEESQAGETSGDSLSRSPAPPVRDGASADVPKKRKRGRPPKNLGSKNTRGEPIVINLSDDSDGGGRDRASRGRRSALVENANQPT